MTRQLFIQICAVVSIIVSAYRAGMYGETIHGEGWFSMLAVLILAIAILGVTLVPT